jgi:hypothetical protein
MVLMFSSSSISTLKASSRSMTSSVMSSNRCRDQSKLFSLVILEASHSSFFDQKGCDFFGYHVQFLL